MKTQSNRLVLLLGAVALCMALIAPAPASGAKLSADRAKKVAARLAERICERERPRCVDSDARYCLPMKAENKRRCTIFLIFRDQGDRIQCRQKVVVTRTDSNRIKTKLGPRRCD